MSCILLLYFKLFTEIKVHYFCCRLSFANNQSFPSSRSSATLTTIAGEQAVLYGGLESESNLFTEVWLFNFDEKAWKNLSFSADSYNAVGRDKHAATMYGCSRFE